MQESASLGLLNSGVPNLFRGYSGLFAFVRNYRNWGIY